MSGLVQPAAPFSLAGITDGQTFVWSAALGLAIPATAAGPEEVSFASNITGTVTGPVSGGNNATGTAVAIPATTVVAPASARPTYLRARVWGQQTTVGDGFAYLEFWETTGAAVLLYRGSGQRLPNSVAATVKSFDLSNEFRLGVVASPRTFELRINCFGIATTPAWQAGNNAAAGLDSRLGVYQL